jgi:hypothetical protein
MCFVNLAGLTNSAFSSGLSEVQEPDASCFFVQNRTKTMDPGLCASLNDLSSLLNFFRRVREWKNRGEQGYHALHCQGDSLTFSIP